MRTEQERIEAAVQRVGDSGASLVFRYVGDGRPYAQIRDRDDRILWDGWWDCAGATFTWREEWVESL